MKKNVNIAKAQKDFGGIGQPMKMELRYLFKYVKTVV